MTHNIAIAGASGRMGHMLIEAVRNAPDCALTGALDIAASPAIGAAAQARLAIATVATAAGIAAVAAAAV
jgi:4-hydroxy-tetrahydrodipicolinate reductase